jgi:hypothetical protein
MKKHLWVGLTVLIFLLGWGATAPAQNVVVDGGFDLQTLNPAPFAYWSYSGTGNSTITIFDTIENDFSWCWETQTWQNNDNYLTQQIAIEQGVQYSVCADFAYSNC